MSRPYSVLGKHIGNPEDNCSPDGEQEILIGRRCINAKVSEVLERFIDAFKIIERHLSLVGHVVTDLADMEYVCEGVPNHVKRVVKSITSQDRDNSDSNEGVIVRCEAVQDKNIYDILEEDAEALENIKAERLEFHGINTVRDLLDSIRALVLANEDYFARGDSDGLLTFFSTNARFVFDDSNKPYSYWCTELDDNTPIITRDKFVSTWKDLKSAIGGGADVSKTTMEVCMFPHGPIDQPPGEGFRLVPNEPEDE